MKSEVHGRLTVLSVRRGDRSRTYATCRCECGVVKEIRADAILRGGTQSCGCLSRDPAFRRAHSSGTGLSLTREYNSWQSMMYRCFNPKSPNWSRYGGRGITVCQEWQDFANFYRDMAPRPDGKTLDRIDPDSNYEKSNCRWATPAEQAINKGIR